MPGRLRAPDGTGGVNHSRRELVKSPEEIWAYLTERIEHMVTRTGMHGWNGESIEGAFFYTLSDLFFMEGREEEWHQKLRYKVTYPYGNTGVAALERWFGPAPDGRARKAAADVAAVYAEFCVNQGFLPDGHRLTDEEWSRLGLDDPAMYTQRDWSRSDLDMELPEPTLRVDKGRVYCFGHEDVARSWVFFDFVGTDWQDADPLLRSIRTSELRSESGMILTPLGTSMYLGRD